MVITFAESHHQFFFCNELIQQGAHTCALGSQCLPDWTLGMSDHLPVAHPLLNGDHHSDRVRGQVDGG